MVSLCSWLVICRYVTTLSQIFKEIHYTLCFFHISLCLFHCFPLSFPVHLVYPPASLSLPLSLSLSSSLSSIIYDPPICPVYFHLPSSLCQRSDQLSPRLSADCPCRREVSQGCDTNRAPPAGSHIPDFFLHIPSLLLSLSFSLTALADAAECKALIRHTSTFSLN